MLEIIISILDAKTTIEKYKIGDKSFVRERKLNFKKMALLLLSKSVKSLQNMLNEFFDKASENFETVTASAFTQARKKLSHKLFVDLNRMIVEMFYAEKTPKKYKNLILVAIDGSKIYLPNSEDIKKEFTTIPVKFSDTPKGEYVGGLASVAFDVLNDIVIDAVITNQKAYEGDLALQHLEHLGPGHLVIFDRGYPSYKLIANCYVKGIDCLFRCSTGWTTESRDMFKSNEMSKIVTLKRTISKRECEELNLPEEVTVRYVKVILENGEKEVLVTSLLDEQLYPTEDFKYLYWSRWGVETLFGVIKNRIALENFTGKTAESVKQDFYSTIFISNFETILTDDATEELEEKSKNNKNSVKVNKSTSFNTIKNKIFFLLQTETDIDVLLKQMTKIFLINPTPIRPGRSFVREKDQPRKSLNYYKRIKKTVF